MGVLERGVALQAATTATMATKPKTTFGLTAALVERLVDGTMRIEGLVMDPLHGDEERRHLAALLGTGSTIGATLPVDGSHTLADGYTLSSLVADYTAEQTEAKRWTLKTAQESAAIYALLLEIVGPSTQVATLSRKTMAGFKETLGKLPVNAKKDKRWRTSTALELASGQGPHVPETDRLSVSTRNKMLNRTSSLLNWAARHGKVALNVAGGMTLAKSKRADERRRPYKEEEMNTLLNYLMTGADSATRHKFPWRRWIPLVAAYSGMRLNEICQLAVSDVSAIAEIAVFSVNDEGEGKRIKTANSRRMVPIHPALVDAGLLSYVAELRLKGTERLWPELNGGRDGYGKTPGRWFNERLRPLLGLEHDFHSLRHTVVNKLREAGVSEDLVADLVGHSRSSRETFGTYAKAASIKRVYEALCLLVY